jgi:hydroxypyruvate isomerase
VLVEAINSVDVPAFPIDSSDAAIAVPGPPESRRAKSARRRAGKQSDPRGQSAPGTGTLDFEPLFAQLAALGYTGSVGLEYVPLDLSDSSASFRWVAETVWL